MKVRNNLDNSRYESTVPAKDWKLFSFQALLRTGKQPVVAETIVVFLSPSGQMLV
jgi:hypothetical protein